MDAAMFLFWAFCIVLTMAMSDIGSLYDNRWRRMYRYSQGELSQRQLRKLAKILMIEADGGDDPAEYLEWAIEECKK